MSSSVLWTGTLQELVSALSEPERLALEDAVVRDRSLRSHFHTGGWCVAYVDASGVRTITHASVSCLVPAMMAGNGMLEPSECPTVIEALQDPDDR